jgi:hypothetical protein
MFYSKYAVEITSPQPSCFYSHSTVEMNGEKNNKVEKKITRDGRRRKKRL